jgi:hypothetical protein
VRRAVEGGDIDRRRYSNMLALAAGQPISAEATPPVGAVQEVGGSENSAVSE